MVCCSKVENRGPPDADWWWVMPKYKRHKKRRKKKYHLCKPQFRDPTNKMDWKDFCWGTWKASSLPKGFNVFTTYGIIRRVSIPKAKQKMTSRETVGTVQIKLCNWSYLCRTSPRHPCPPPDYQNQSGLLPSRPKKSDSLIFLGCGITRGTN